MNRADLEGLLERIDGTLSAWRPILGPGAARGVDVGLTLGEWDTILAALRASGAGGEMRDEIVAIGHLRSYSTRERCAVACMDLADSYREVAEDHIRNRQAEPAAKAIAWADGAMRCAAAVLALPLDGGRP